MALKQLWKYTITFLKSLQKKIQKNGKVKKLQLRTSFFEIKEKRNYSFTKASITKGEKEGKWYRVRDTLLGKPGALLLTGFWHHSWGCVGPVFALQRNLSNVAKALPERKE
jgi:hypothetical protein